MPDEGRVVIGVAVAAALLLCAPPAAGQQDDRVEIEPVRCWWRTETGDVRVGQPFSVLLTCAVLETSAARVILDESRLDPRGVQLQPFDVIDGARTRELVTASRRFIQFQYTLRIIGDLFGREASVPSLQLTYRIESRVGEAGVESTTGEVVQGRDLTYTMPALAVRVISTVPESARDIREAPAVTFSEMERASFRGLMLKVIGATLFGVAALLVLSLLRPAAQRHRPESTPAAVVSDSRILAAARQELAGILERARQTGWSADRVGRALSALRIVAAYAAGQPVSRARASAGAIAREGQLLVRSRTGPVLVSASTTAGALGERTDLAPLRDALERFSRTRYGRGADMDPGAARLDETLERAMETADGLAGRYSWRARRTAALRRSVADVRERLWAR